MAGQAFTREDFAEIRKDFDEMRAAMKAMAELGPDADFSIGLEAGPAVGKIVENYLHHANPNNIIILIDIVKLMTDTIADKEQELAEALGVDDIFIAASEYENLRQGAPGAS